MKPAPPRGRGLAAALAVARRDLLEFVRDRRTLVITLLMPMVMYPVLALSSMLGLRTALSDIEARRAPRQLAVLLSGGDAEPFATRLRQAIAAAAADPPAGWPAGVTIDVIPAAEASGRLDAGRGDVWLHAGPGTVQDLDGDGTVRLDARVATSQPVDPRVREHVLAVVKALADDARSRRIARAGLAPTALMPLAVDFPEGGAVAAEARGIASRAAGAVLLLLALLTATGGFYPAIDAIAGEKERGTIETLLIAPCRPRTIVFGKYLAVFAVTLATLAMNVLSIGLTAAVLLRSLPTGGLAGLAPWTVAGFAATALVAYTGLASVAAALCLALTSASKSVKEAQNTLTPVILLISGLAGAALVPGTNATTLAAVPFAGQVSVAKAVLDDAEAAVGVPERARHAGLRLAISLGSSLLVTWLLLRATTAAVTDEEILFRGPDAAATKGWRPVRRDVPTPGQAVAAAGIGLAGLWYAQGLCPADLARALPIQQGLSTVLPLAVMAWWQRVNPVVTLRLRWPARRFARGLACLAAAAAAGGCLFLVGAAALLAVRGTHLTPEARQLSERLVQLFVSRPPWASWLLIAALPAVCEECLFRGWMLAAFTGRRPAPRRAVAAVVLQAACFAAFHLLPERMPQTFALGLLLGWMTLRSGSILPAILAHLVHNTVPLGLFLAAADTDAAGLASDAVPGPSARIVGGALGCLAVAIAAVWLATRGPRATTTA